MLCKDILQQGEQMKLSDLKPKRVSIPLDVTNSDGEVQNFELVLRPYTLADEAWTEEEYKDKAALVKVFEEINMYEICRMAFHQSTIETQRKIMAVKFAGFDAEGNEVEVNKLPHEKLMGMISGFESGIKIFKGLLECKGLSMPMIEKMAEEDLKKKGLLKKEDSLIGLLSSI